MTVLSEIAAVLKTTEKNALVRAAKMQLTPVCGRCGGCGSYSFNMTDGSRCYGCNGTGHVTPKEKDLPEVLENAKEVAANGKLDAYIEELAASKRNKTARERAMKAWSESEVSKTNSAIGHLVRSEEVEGLTELRTANAAMHDAYKAVEEATYNKKLTAVEIDAIVEASIAKIIEAAKFEVPENLKTLAAETTAKRKAAHKARFGI